jgi:hypothetical protein
VVLRSGDPPALVGSVASSTLNARRPVNFSDSSRPTYSLRVVPRRITCRGFDTASKGNFVENYLGPQGTANSYSVRGAVAQPRRPLFFGIPEL